MRATGPLRGLLAAGLLLAHELMHIANRRNPERATRLYRLLGFEPVAPLGGDTGYVFHRQETLADNVAFLASGRAVPTRG